MKVIISGSEKLHYHRSLVVILGGKSMKSNLIWVVNEGIRMWMGVQDQPQEKVQDYRSRNTQKVVLWVVV